MSARVLVVDDIAINVKLLEAKLSSEYFDVLSASSGSAALEIADYGYVLETGEVVLDGEASSLLGNARVQASYLGGGH